MRTVPVDAAPGDDRPLRERKAEIEKANVVRLPGSHSSYEPHEIERALLELAICGGRYTACIDRLERIGLEIPDSTLTYWSRVSHSDRYAELAASVAKDLEKKIAAEAEAYIMRAAEVELRILNRLADRVDRDEADVVVLSNALRNVSVSKGIAMDKVASPIRGRPTVIQGQADNFDQLLSRLERLQIQFRGEQPAIDVAPEDVQEVDEPSD